MNKFLKMLYDEHKIIVNAIDAAQQAKSLIGKDDTLYESTIRKLITFFRNYADRFHHYKEEEILFPEMNKRNELLAEGVIKEMFDNHEDFRAMIRSIENKLDAKKFTEAQGELEKYANALLDHIAVENDEVFVMAETLFSENELEDIMYRFDDCDRDLGEKQKLELEELADSLRKKMMLID
ncbi:MAG TPA: hemerythrin domain-containing protein [Bacteroidia bacterium]|nr:hemerythrin domain-containing protein [Bacteroidia bacterium]